MPLDVLLAGAPRIIDAKGYPVGLGLSNFQTTPTPPFGTHWWEATGTSPGTVGLLRSPNTPYPSGYTYAMCAHVQETAIAVNNKWIIMEMSHIGGVLQVLANGSAVDKYKVQFAEDGTVIGSASTAEFNRNTIYRWTWELHATDGWRLWADDTLILDETAATTGGFTPNVVYLALGSGSFSPYSSTRKWCQALLGVGNVDTDRPSCEIEVTGSFPNGAGNYTGWNNGEPEVDDWDGGGTTDDISTILSHIHSTSTSRESFTLTSPVTALTKTVRAGIWVARARASAASKSIDWEAFIRAASLDIDIILDDLQVTSFETYVTPFTTMPGGGPMSTSVEIGVKRTDDSESANIDVSAMAIEWVAFEYEVVAPSVVAVEREVGRGAGRGILRGVA